MSKDTTKNRLADLKAAMESDPIVLDTSILTPNLSDFPASESIKYIDYDGEKKKNHKEFATQVITNIIDTYIKSENLLNSPRLKDLKQDHIKTYAHHLLMSEIADANLIKMQEFIDAGDMSKDAFMSVRTASVELRDCITAYTKHLSMCDKYWSEYAAKYGMEDGESKIVQQTEIKEDDNKKLTIFNASELTANIHEILAKQKAKEQEDNAEKD